MKHDQEEAPLTYALDISGKMVYIGCVCRGLSCNCRCPKCNEPLEAKLGNNKGRQAHFAHCKGSDCHGSYMAALHILAEQIIEEEKAVMAPSYKEIDMQRLSFEKVEVEQRVERKDLQPDIVGIKNDGTRWAIEIKNTHEVKEPKRLKLIESGITCLEIDVSGQNLEGLKFFLLESADSREWINNPNYENQLTEMKRKKVSQIRKCITDNHKLEVPPYKDIKAKIIDLNEVCVLSETEDGLNVILKVISSDGIPYILNICSQDSKEDFNNSLVKKEECNRLTIIVDDNDECVDDQSKDYNIRWSYYQVLEAERELFKKFKSKLRQLKYCHDVCPTREKRKDCIFEKEIIIYQGIKYIVCNKVMKQPINKVGIPSNDQTLKQTFVVNTLLENRKAQTHKELKLETLPFDRYWTVEDYYKIITSSHKTETGNYIRVVKSEIIGTVILLLYEDPKIERTYWPFHIVTITIKNGVAEQKNVGDFVTESKALKSFQDRSKTMNVRANYNKIQERNDNDLPF